MAAAPYRHPRKVQVQMAHIWWAGGGERDKGTGEVQLQKSYTHITFGIFWSFIHELLTILFSKSVYPNDLWGGGRWS